MHICIKINKLYDEKTINGRPSQKKKKKYAAYP